MIYKTVESSSKSNYKQNGSTFLGIIEKIDTIQEFKAHLKSNKIEHKSASHVCSAYRVINNGLLQEKASDDGEPSGSAGTPILNQSKRSNIINVGLYVVRYFGGKKLGIPGLIHAYSETIRSALSNAILIDWEPSDQYTLNHSYSDIEYLDFLFKKYDIVLHDRVFVLFVDSIVEIKDSLFEKFNNELIIKNLPHISLVKIK